MQNPSTAQALVALTKTMNEFSGQMANIIKEIATEEKVIECIRPYYLNPLFKDKIKLPIVYRFSQNNMRFYFTINPDAVATLPFESSAVTFYPSVTTIIDKTTPTGYGLKKLIGDLGIKGFYQMMKEKAHYGTFLHMLISDYLRSGDTKETRSFDFDEIHGRIKLFVEENRIDFEVNDWNWGIRKDMASLIQFLWDYQVEPIAIETVGIYNDGQYRFAGAIDLICEMTIKEKGYWGELYKSGENKGEPKETYQERRVTALVDFKSGKSGFFDDHEIQLHMYKIMAEQSLGISPEKVFNVAPKEWINEPTYSIKDQTDSIHARKIPHLLGAFAVEYVAPKDILIIDGKVNGSGSLSDVCRYVSASEYVLKHL